MQKLVFVDKFDRKYKRLQRVATAIAKTDHSLRLSSTLRNRFLADDRKTREYCDRAGRRLMTDRDPSRATRLGERCKKETDVF